MRDELELPEGTSLWTWIGVGARNSTPRPQRSKAGIGDGTLFEFLTPPAKVGDAYRFEPYVYALGDGTPDMAGSPAAFNLRGEPRDMSIFSHDGGMLSACDSSTGAVPKEAIAAASRDAPAGAGT